MSYQIFQYQPTKRFCIDVFQRYGFTKEESESITDILLSADLFGIESHGIQRLVRYHKEINDGMVDVKAVPETVTETPISAVIDANKGMGQLISKSAMKLAIEKAKKTGVGMVSVRNSNHYGIAGYYVRMALEEDLIGVCMTNTQAIGVPTFGKQAMLGTSPIALGLPATPIPFLFDAATTVVPRGKIEVYNKNGKSLPDNWAIDAQGLNTNDPALLLRNIITQAGGGIAPLGGVGDLYSGYKGYGFGVIVDIFTGILSGGKTSNHVSVNDNQADIAHFFAAIDYSVFGDKADISERLSIYLQELRDSAKAYGQSRIYTHGEKELESEGKKLAEGFPINQATIAEMKNIAEFHSLDYDAYF